MTDGAKFVCVDGPEFDGHLVDWGNLVSRVQYYKDEEQAAVEHWQQGAITSATWKGADIAGRQVDK